MSQFEFDPNLRGKEAIEYLQRARSTLHPKVDQFAEIPLLASMLDVQIAFFENKILQGRENLVIFTRARHGFPELESWVLDINSLFGEFDAVKQKRAEAFLPLLQQISDISERGITEQNEKLATVLREDLELINMQNNIPEYLKKRLRRLNPNAVSIDGLKGVPFALDNCPGLLRIRPLEEDMIFESRIGRVDVGVVVSFKYLDSKDQSLRLPTTLYFYNEYHYEDYYANKLSCRALVPESPLLDRTVIEYEDSEKIFWRRFQNTRQTPISVSNRGQLDNTLKLTEMPNEQQEKMNVALLRAYRSLDPRPLSDASINAFLASLPRLNRLISQMAAPLEDILKGNPLKATDCVASINELSGQMISLFNSLEDDDGKLALQLAVAEAIKPLIGQTKELVFLPAVAKETKRKRRFLPFGR